MTSADQPPIPDRGHSLRWIMAGVLVWGITLALGAFLFGGNRPLLRALIIVGVVAAFLIFWLAALALRQRRLERNRRSADSAGH